MAGNDTDAIKSITEFMWIQYACNNEWIVALYGDQINYSLRLCFIIHVPGESVSAEYWPSPGQQHRNPCLKILWYRVKLSIFGHRNSFCAHRRHSIVLKLILSNSLYQVQSNRVNGEISVSDANFIANAWNTLLPLTPHTRPTILPDCMWSLVAERWPSGLVFCIQKW